MTARARHRRQARSGASVTRSLIPPLCVLLAWLPGVGSAQLLELTGLDGEMADNVRQQLRLASEPCSASRWRVRRLFEAADAEVALALKPFGHYRPEIIKQLDFGEACWTARIQVNAGEPVRWQPAELELTGEGHKDPALQAVLAKRRPETGAPARHADYEGLKAALLLEAAQRGYREGRFTLHQLRVDPAAGTAVAIVHYDTGPRYRFGEVSIEQDALAPDFVRRYVGIKPGDPYDSKAVTQLRRDLLDSGLFQRVQVTPRLGTNAERQVPIDVQLTPRKRHGYIAGIGASSDEGPRLRLGYENRRLNRRGHTGSAALRLSAPRTSLDLGYDMPLADPRRERLSLLAGYLNEQFDDLDSETYKFGARYTREHRQGLLETWFVEASQDRFRIGEDTGDTRLLMPGIAWDWRHGDNLIHPRDGWRLMLELRGGSRFLLSDVDFARAHLRAKRVLSFGEYRLLARAEAGYSLVGGFDDLPASQRFFAGGDSSVRGYGYRDLGPTDSLGRVVGGQRLLVGSLEVERPITTSWSVAAFFDTGDAFDGRDLQLHHAVGLGVRWRSPVGPVRVDLAHPLDPDADAVRLHFSLGPDL